MMSRSAKLWVHGYSRTWSNGFASQGICSCIRKPRLTLHGRPICGQEHNTDLADNFLPASAVRNLPAVQLKQELSAPIHRCIETSRRTKHKRAVHRNPSSFRGRTEVKHG